MSLRLTAAAAVASLLTSLALFPLVMGWRWFWLGAGAVVVVAAAGAATRLRVLPAVVCFAATLAAEFLYLNAVYAGQRSWLHVFPTRASMQHLGQLVAQASKEMSRYAPAVPAWHGILLVITAGVGLVAALTDLIAVRLRKPALAGLPLLVLFCVALTTDAQPRWAGETFALCLGMAGYLSLLSADGKDRLRLWGRLVHRWPGEQEGRRPDTRPLTAAGRRVGSAAVVLAICLPLLLPGLKQHRLFSGGAGTGHGGHATPSLPNPVAALGQQLNEPQPRTVLTYHASDRLPPYFRVYVLTRLTKDAWSLAQPAGTTRLGSGRLPPVPGLVPGTGGRFVHESISLGAGLTGGGGDLTYLPVPYAARWVSVPGSWEVDPQLSVLAPGATLAGLHYTVISDDINPSQQQLRRAELPPTAAAALASYLQVPREFDPLRALAERITKGRTTDFGRALALQQWFTRPGNFTYTLHVPAAQTSHALIDFLTRAKRGYCQQFAFAMAVLARLLQIPSRVVVGYTQGAAAGNTWHVMTSDAHAWPELYFAGAGWLRFEPTPSGGLGQATATTPAYTVPALGSSSPGGAGAQAPGGTAGQRKVQAGRQVAPQLRKGQAGSTVGPRARGSSVPIAPILLGLAALLLIMPRTARSVTRRWRWLRASSQAAQAHTAWRELRDDLADLRIGYRASETPRALARRLGSVLWLAGAEQAALDRVVLAEEQASYAKGPPATSATLRKDLTTVRRAAGRAGGLPARLSALLLPVSALLPFMTALQHVLDVFGWMDVLGAWVRRMTVVPGLRRARNRRGDLALSWRP